MNIISAPAAFDASQGASMSVHGAASEQWFSRPDDQRFLNLTDWQAFVHDQHMRSEQIVRPNRALTFEALDNSDHRGLYATIEAPRTRSQTRGDLVPVDPSHWAFGQVCGLASTPAGFMRELPAELAADVLNYRLRFSRGVEEIGMLLRRPTVDDCSADEHREFAAATGPQYGRIFNDGIARALVSRFGDGVTGDWRVPGEFGKAVSVTKSNTTIYASDRDIFVFLTDERNKIEVKNRRNGKSGEMSRGFYVYNSEVGSMKFGLASFFFDFVCMNRNIWGVEGFEELTFRHSSGAPNRFIERALPALERYAQSSTRQITTQIEAAQSKKIDDVDKFLANRKFTGKQVLDIKAAHMSDEGRPIESIFDASNGITAFARSIPHQSDRVDIERRAGEVFALAR